MGAKRYNPSMRAPLPVVTTPRQRLLSYLRRAREEAVAMAADGANMAEAIISIDDVVKEVYDAVPE